jgi:hypothetical protein
MDIFHYHPISGALLGASKADRHPIVEDEWLLPAFSTPTPPPTVPEGEMAVWEGEAWALHLVPPPAPEQEPGPAPEPPPQPPPTDVSFWQFMMAAWKLNFITHEEALAAVRSRIMPAAFAQAMVGLPAEAKLEAELKFAGITRMLRSDPLFGLVVEAAIATDEQIDGVFAVAAAIA